MLRPLLLFALVLPAGVVRAAELSGSLALGTSYNSNIFRTETDTVSDWGFRVTPRINLNQSEGRFQYGLGYSGIWEKYLEKKVADRITDWDHLITADASYGLGPRTRVRVADRFRRLQNVNNFLTDPNADPDVPTPLLDDRFPVTLNTATLGFDHRFDRRVSGFVDFTYDLFDSENPTAINSQALAGVVDLDYKMDRVNNFGIGAAATYQDFDETIGQPSADSQIYRVYGRYSRDLGEHTSLIVQAGPAFIVSTTQAQGQRKSPTVLFVRPVDADGMEIAGVIGVPDTATCGAEVPIVTLPECVARVPIFDDPNDPLDAYSYITNENFNVRTTIRLADTGGTQTNNTVFGLARIRRSWTRGLTSSLGFRRTQGLESGRTRTTIRDTVSFTTSWNPDNLWRLFLRAAWVQRESAVPESRTSAEIGLQTLPPPFEPGTFVAYTGKFIHVDEKTSTRRWEVRTRVQRYLGKHLTVSLDLVFLDQTRANPAAINAPLQFQEYSAVLNVRYAFDPIKLPIPDV